MTEYQRTDTANVDARQWVEGTTTVEQMREVAPEAFVRDGKLYLPSPTDPYVNEPVPNNAYVFHEVDTTRNYIALQSVFESMYEPVIA